MIMYKVSFSPLIFIRLFFALNNVVRRGCEATERKVCVEERDSMKNTRRSATFIFTQEGQKEMDGRVVDTFCFFPHNYSSQQRNPAKTKDPKLLL